MAYGSNICSLLRSDDSINLFLLKYRSLTRKSVTRGPSLGGIRKELPETTSWDEEVGATLTLSTVANQPSCCYSLPSYPLWKELFLVKMGCWECFPKFYNNLFLHREFQSSFFPRNILNFLHSHHIFSRKAKNMFLESILHACNPMDCLSFLDDWLAVLQIAHVVYLVFCFCGANPLDQSNIAHFHV